VEKKKKRKELFKAPFFLPVWMSLVGIPRLLAQPADHKSQPSSLWHVYSSGNLHLSYSKSLGPNLAAIWEQQEAFEAALTELPAEEAAFFELMGLPTSFSSTKQPKKALVTTVEGEGVAENESATRKRKRNKKKNKKKKDNKKAKLEQQQQQQQPHDGDEQEEDQEEDQEDDDEAPESAPILKSRAVEETTQAELVPAPAPAKQDVAEPKKYFAKPVSFKEKKKLMRRSVKSCHAFLFSSSSSSFFFLLD